MGAGAALKGQQCVAGCLAIPSLSDRMDLWISGTVYEEPLPRTVDVKEPTVTGMRSRKLS